MAITLKPHQEKAVNELGNGKVLLGGVGVGKSITAMAYYMQREAPKDIYVITTAKKRDDKDWVGEAAPFGVGTAKDATIAGVLHVDSWNNITDYTEVKDAFFIFDEQRLVGSGAWVKAFYKIAKANRWIMLSATPGDIWSDYIPLFVANGFYKNKTAFIDRHVVWSRFSKFPKIDRYVDTGILNAYRRRLLVDMPYERHTTRHKKIVRVEHDVERFRRVVKERWNIFDDKPIKDVAELFRVMRRLVNSDPARIDTVTQLMQTHPRLIIFYNFNYELDMLRKMCEELWVPFAEWNGHKHQALPEGDKWVYLVQYTAGAEGWNCITTDAMIFFSLNYSYKIFEQAQGRTDRLNTPFTDLYYYVLKSDSAIDRAIWKSLNTKKSFNESQFTP